MPPKYLALLVDDSKELLKMATQHLEEKGIASISAESGRKALSLFKEQKPNIIITDLKMKDGNGLWLLREIRGEDITIPVIFLSAFVTEIRDSLFEQGATAVFSKPQEYVKMIDFVFQNSCIVQNTKIEYSCPAGISTMVSFKATSIA